MILVQALEQKLIYQTREYAHDFCMEMSEHINELFTTQCKLVKIEEQNWFIDAWRHDTTVRGCISTLETIDRKFGNNNAVKMLENFDSNLHYTIESLNDNDVNGDIYIKMNGRGVPLTEYENLKYQEYLQAENQYQAQEAITNAAEGSEAYKDEQNKLEQMKISRDNAYNTYQNAQTARMNSQRTQHEAATNYYANKRAAQNLREGKDANFNASKDEVYGKSDSELRQMMPELDKVQNAGPRSQE